MAATRDKNGRFCRTGNDICHKGYRVVYAPHHCRSKSNGYVYEHILVAENKLGRPLAPGEVVHHIDGNKLNNDENNLMVFASQSEHYKHHWETRGGLYRLSDGRVLTMNELSEISGLPSMTLYQRIKILGWSVDDAIMVKKYQRRNAT